MKTKKADTEKDVFTRRKALKTGIGTAASSSLLLSGCLSSVTGGPKELKLALPTALSYEPLGTAGKKFKELSEQKSDEELEITILPAGQYGSQPEMLEGVSSGALALTSNPLDIIFTDWAITNFPYMYETPRAKNNDISLESSLIKSLDDDAQKKHNIKLLSVFVVSQRQLVTKFDARSPNEVDNEPIRTIASPFYQALGRGLGGDPVPIDAGEIATAMSNGTIKGLSAEYQFANLLGLWEVADYTIHTGHLNLFQPLMINTGIFEDLSSKSQTAVLEAGKEIVPHTQDALESSREKIRSKVESETTVVSKEELQMDKFRESTREEVLNEFPSWEERLNKHGYNV